jgi:hypothetical protein
MTGQRSVPGFFFFFFFFFFELSERVVVVPRFVKRRPTLGQAVDNSLFLV